MKRLRDCPLLPHVVRMWRENHPLKSIARVLGLHPSAVVRRLRAAGLPRRWQRLSSSERRTIRAMLDQDLSRREVARQTGRSLGTVGRIGSAAQRLPDDTVRRVRSWVRCGGCGALINVLPCITCAAREATSACRIKRSA